MNLDSFKLISYLSKQFLNKICKGIYIHFLKPFIDLQSQLFGIQFY